MKWKEIDYLFLAALVIKFKMLRVKEVKDLLTRNPDIDKREFKSLLNNIRKLMK